MGHHSQTLCFLMGDMADLLTDVCFSFAISTGLFCTYRAHLCLQRDMALSLIHRVSFPNGNDAPSAYSLVETLCISERAMSPIRKHRVWE